MFLVGHLPRIADTAAATLTETTVAYRHSALSVRHGAHHRGTAQAGEHAPDPDGLLGPDGNPVTIEDLLTRPGMLLLVRSTDEVDDLRATLGDLGTVVRVVRDGASADGVTGPGDVLGRAYGLGSRRRRHGPHPPRRLPRPAASRSPRTADAVEARGR